MCVSGEFRNSSQRLEEGQTSYGRNYMHVVWKKAIQNNFKWLRHFSRKTCNMEEDEK